MAEYNKHSLDYYYDGINRYEINRKSANANMNNLITIDNISFDGDEYEVEITISNLSDDVKNNIIDHSGRLRIEIGRMRCGTDGLAGYRRPHHPGGIRNISMKTAPNHHFRRHDSFEFTIPNRELDQPHTYTLYLSEYDITGLNIDDDDTVRYKNQSKAEGWQYIILRTRFRINLFISNDSCPYRLNSEEIVTYNNFY